MKLLKIKGIAKDFVIEPGKIYNIDVESTKYYHDLVIGILDTDVDIFIYSSNYKCVDFNKESLFISDLFSVDPNSKKILNALYKKIQDNFTSSANEIIIQDINTRLLSLLEQISFDVNLDVEYDTSLDISKILSLYRFSFANESDNLLKKLIIYIKANMEIMNLSFIISLNLLSLIKETDIQLLQKELELLGLSLININLTAKPKNDLIDQITIDQDLCEF